VGSDVYRTWLADASDLIVPGGTRPLPHDPGAADPKTLHARFFDSMFQMFGPGAYGGINERMKAHFLTLLDAKKDPVLTRRAPPSGRTGGVTLADGEGGREEEREEEEREHEHPEEVAAAAAAAVARDAAAAERRRLRGAAAGDASDEDDGYQPVLFNDYDEDDEDMMGQLPTAQGEEEIDIFRMDTQGTQTQGTQPGVLDSAERRVFAGAGRANTPSSVGRGHGHGHGLGGGFTPSSRGGFSLADMLDGRAMDAGQDALNYSMGASIEASFRGDGPGSGGGNFEVGSEGPEPSSIGGLGSISMSVPERLTQYKLKESGPADGEEDTDGEGEGEGDAGAVASGEAMLAAARSASAVAVGQPAYNLLQYLSANVFNGHLGSGGGGVGAKSLSELCVENRLSRGKSAKCFYQCLVLVGGGFLDAAQDLSRPYGVGHRRCIPNPNTLNPKPYTVKPYILLTFKS